MCGIAGILYKGNQGDADVGQSLVKMLTGCQHRGEDSTGFAIYGPTDPASHGPYGGTIRVLRSADAVTSYKRREEEDPSMRAIQPGEVIEVLNALS